MTIINIRYLDRRDTSARDDNKSSRDHDHFR